MVLSAFGDVLDRERRQAAWVVWHHAALSRRGKGALPSIDVLLGIKEEVKRQSPAEAQSVFAAIRQQAAG